MKAAAFDPAQVIPDSSSTSSEAALSVIVLAADTTVWHDGRILNKPVDAADARRMLTTLRGREHQVFTGLCLRLGDEYLVEHEVTTVKFGHMSDEWITRYVESGEPLDKAGAYGAQERGALMIERIEGDYFNVVGLPLACLGRMLETIGAPVEAWWQRT